ncbi:hypothetical protein KAJ27_23510 [bacterium]|nr:hypothetical protein [bacterium]
MKNHDKEKNPESGEYFRNIPCGIELLVKKASVDEEFRKLLIEKRDEAAYSIDLELSPSEIVMLKVVPVEQLKMIIDETVVAPEHKSSLMGKIAAVMIAALGFSVTSCCDKPKSGDEVGELKKNEVIKQVNTSKKVLFPSDLRIDAKTLGIRPDHPVVKQFEEGLNNKDVIIEEPDSEKMTDEIIKKKRRRKIIYKPHGEIGAPVNREGASSRGMRPDRP